MIFLTPNPSAVRKIEPTLCVERILCRIRMISGMDSVYHCKKRELFDTIGLMDEDKIQQQARDQDEQSTQRRAAILGLPYIDTRELQGTLSLVEGVLETEYMHRNRIIPLVAGSDSESWQFGITTQTPQSALKELADRYAAQAQGVTFFLISQGGFRALMERYDPPVQVTYDDIKIASEDDSETLEQVSKTLNSVGSDEVFDYLIEQADRLGASDIHIENQRQGIRIRMRIDGALHPVAMLDSDRYRVILGALASRANVSTASNEPQSGHMQKEVTVDGSTHMLNMRVEVVPTMYGQDSVIRLFNYDESMLNLDRLNISTDERARIDEVISHPRGMVLMVGPTGSGKSTTLYSMISALNAPDRKIITSRTQSNTASLALRRSLSILRMVKVLQNIYARFCDSIPTSLWSVRFVMPTPLERPSKLPLPATSCCRHSTRTVRRRLLAG